MSETRNPFANENTDSLVGYLRDVADRLLEPNCRSDFQLRAAADRLHVLYHDADLGARSGRVSERALIEARREGYVRGAYDWALSDSPEKDRILIRMNFRYPLPRVTRPLRVTLSDGSVWSYEPKSDDDDGELFPLVLHSHSDGPRRTGLRRLGGHAKGAGDYAKLARILSGETEEVESEDRSPCPPHGTMNDVQGPNGLRD